MLSSIKEAALAGSHSDSDSLISTYQKRGTLARDERLAQFRDA